MMLTLGAFVFALAILIAVHEYGHYLAARGFGVRILRFSIGFGRPLILWRSPLTGTEFVLGMIPLGGFVRMLDEREGPVPASDRAAAFNAQSLGARAAIVLAGPLANLILAVALYSVVNWIGVQQPAAVLSKPVPGSLAERSGLSAGDRVQRLGFLEQALNSITSFDDLHWMLVRGALESRDLEIEVLRGGAAEPMHVTLRLSQLAGGEADTEMFRRIGILGPFSPALIGEVVPGLPADKAGLVAGDRVLRLDEVPVSDGPHLRQLIRDSAGKGPPRSMSWQVIRADETIVLLVTPDVIREGEQYIGKVGATIGGAPEWVLVKKGPWEGLAQGLARTVEASTLTIKMLGRMIIGQASLTHLSGPITIANFAGKSASSGLTHYLTFLALISVSLGVLNLLPIPVLDGGHLMYYLWEGLSGRPVSESVMDRFQKGGLALLILMTAIALFNDVSRLMG